VCVWRRIDPRVRPVAGPRAGAKTDNVAQLGDELAVARQLELTHAMRLEAMGVPDPLHRADADPDLFGHHLDRPMRHLARRIGLRQRNRALVHCRRQPRDPRRTGLVAQQPVDPLRHETLRQRHTVTLLSASIVLRKRMNS
jgi:hypothetical protein